MRRTRDKGRPARRGISRGAIPPRQSCGAGSCAVRGLMGLWASRSRCLFCLSWEPFFIRTPQGGASDHLLYAAERVYDAGGGRACRPFRTQGRVAAGAAAVRLWGNGVRFFRFVREPAGMASHTRLGAAPLGILYGTLVGDFYKEADRPKVMGMVAPRSASAPRCTRPSAASSVRWTGGGRSGFPWPRCRWGCLP